MRHTELLRVALDEFLEHGFDRASVEGIAAEAGMSKRTIYSRYQDKAALFRAAIDRAVDRYTVPLESLQQAESDDLRTTLLRVARIRVANLSLPDTIKLQRVLTAQSYRFPDLFRDAFGRSLAPTVEFLESQFAAHAAKGELAIGDPRATVSAFLSLVVGGPARIIVAGDPVNPAKIERHLAFTVDLFLNGIRSR